MIFTIWPYFWIRNVRTFFFVLDKLLKIALPITYITLGAKRKNLKGKINKPEGFSTNKRFFWGKKTVFLR